MEITQTKNLFIIRGIPGSGKTTVAEIFSQYFGNTLENAPLFSADQFFEKEVDGKIEYKFDVTKLGAAHAACMRNTEESMKKEYLNIFVANTFTMEREINPYKALAEKYGYRFFSIIVENRHGNTNIHSVSDEKLEEMRKRFVLNL